MICISVLNNTNENHAIMRKSNPKKKGNNLNWFEKQVNRIPGNVMEKLFLLIFVLFVVLQIVTTWSCMDTLLPVCIPWMYYLYIVVGGVFLLSFVVNPIRKHFLHKKKSISDSYELKIIMILIIVPAIIFLPNRYIPIESGTEYQGEIVSQTSFSGTKSTSSKRNYVKIKLNQEDTSFWYSLNKESKPLGSKCIVTVRRGIFGMRYVENVVFLVE